MNAALLLPTRFESPPWVTDEDDSLATKLRRRVGNRVRHLRIERLPAGVVIRGESASFYGKQLAQQAVMELVDEPILANEIAVD